MGWRQVDAIVWNEMRAAYRALSVDAPWGMRMFPGSPQIESTTMPEDHFAVGFATSERVQDRTMPMGAGLQGFHSPHLLVVVSEAHAVAQQHITAPATAQRAVLPHDRQPPSPRLGSSSNRSTASASSTAPSRYPPSTRRTSSQRHPTRATPAFPAW